MSGKRLHAEARPMVRATTKSAKSGHRPGEQGARPIGLASKVRGQSASEATCRSAKRCVQDAKRSSVSANEMACQQCDAPMSKVEWWPMRRRAAKRRHGMPSIQRGAKPSVNGRRGGTPSLSGQAAT